MRALRERIALWIAPWLFFRNRTAAEDAFRDLAEIAYGSRAAVWTSHRTLVRVALEETERRASRAERGRAT